MQQEGVVDVLFWTRTTLKIKILELPREMQMVEWPLCDCVLKTDLSAPGNPQYTVAGNLASHLCGDRHRKKIVSLLQSPQQSLPSILIVSKLWSFTLHPLTGKMQCIQKHTRCSATDASLWPDKQNRNWPMKYWSRDNSFKAGYRLRIGCSISTRWSIHRPALGVDFKMVCG